MTHWGVAWHATCCWPALQCTALQVQTIGLLSFLKHKGVHGPFLVVGPLSTLTNWVNEFHRFCPDMPALLYHGSPREREVLRRTRLRVGGSAIAPGT